MVDQKILAVHCHSKPQELPFGDQVLQTRLHYGIESVWRVDSSLAAAPQEGKAFRLTGAWDYQGRLFIINLLEHFYASLNVDLALLQSLE